MPGISWVRPTWTGPWWVAPAWISRPSSTSFRKAGQRRYNSCSAFRRDAMVYYDIATIYIVTCILLVLVILLQQGKGGDIANAFGGGASQAAFGARSGATVLSRATTVCAVIFVAGGIMLGILGQRGPGSVLSGRG